MFPIRRWSPYNYALDNPVMFVDPDGMKARDYPVLEYYNPQPDHITHDNMQSYMGGARGGGGGGLASANMYGNINGGGYTGSGITFGQTQAYRDLMSAYWSGNSTGGGMTNKNGILTWWTDMQATGITGDIQGLKGNSLRLPEGGSNWYDIGSKANWLFGAAATFSGIKGGLNAERMYGEGIRRGISSNYALQGRNLSQFGKMAATEASLPVSFWAKWGGVAGKVSFGAAVLLDYRALEKGEISEEKFYLNTGIGIYGLRAVGTIPSILYFGIDAFYPGGWTGNAEHPGVFNDQARLNQENSFNPYWQIWPGAMKQ